ncbi:MAG: DNA polymerase/3'-5' exonuclease PolX [Candidatus Nanoarchaeia archaeon]
MHNLEIAKIFYEMADILELLDVPWKPRAYRKAAKSLETLAEDVEELYKKGGLKALEQIPGIGERLAKKIEEFIKTKEIHEYKELKKKIPAGLADLMEIESIGPKKAIILWKKLGITNLEELKAALKEHKIAQLRGFGPKSEQNIAEGIALFEQRHTRFLLGEVLPIARTIIGYLKTKIPEIEQISEAGSVRRRKETVGDLDILVTIKDPRLTSKVMDTFTSMPFVKKVLAKGQTKSIVILKNALQADVRVVKSESFGAALQYFTGSKEHNIAIRRIAVEKGYKLSEYGLFDRISEKLVAGKTEKEIYKKLGLSYIPPELRENAGEIEAAKKNAIPKLVELADIKGDLHVHTNWSDGTASIEEMVSYAQSLGYQYVCISDHSKTRAIAHGLDEERLSKQLKEIKIVQKKFPNIKILTGSEVDILADGSLDFPDEVLKKLDVVIASIHTGWKMPLRKMTSRIIKALENPYVDILGHPTGRIIQKRKPYLVDLEQIYEVAAEKGKILELDAFPDRLDLKDSDVKKAIEKGVYIAIDTDAHATNQLDLIEYGVATARRGWASAENIVNCYPLKDLPKFLKKIVLD